MNLHCLQLRIEQIGQALCGCAWSAQENTVLVVLAKTHVATYERTLMDAHVTGARRDAESALGGGCDEPAPLSGPGGGQAWAHLHGAPNQDGDL